MMALIPAKSILKHVVLLLFLGASLFPFILIGLNSFRSTPEIRRGAIGTPHLVREFFIEEQGEEEPRPFATFWLDLTVGYTRAWKSMGSYIPNTLFVAIVTGAGVAIVASLCAFALARYTFAGSKALFLIVMSMMMIPGILTLIPSFLLVKQLGLLNSFSGLILPYIAGGQIFAIFLLKGFFDDLPQDLFDAAQIDGAGPLRMYWHIAIPLSKPIVYLVMALNILAVWNNFLWPYIINTDPKYHLIPSGIYLLSRQLGGQGDLQSLFASYMLSAVPMLLLFIIATKAFMKGITAGAFKA